jgi:hypothetical protein
MIYGKQAPEVQIPLECVEQNYMHKYIQCSHDTSKDHYIVHQLISSESSRLSIM